MSASEIDSLARDIEQTIQQNKERLAELPDFEVGRRHRITQESNIINVHEYMNDE
jgi:hypothetical protein